jgi:hypothetical protein
MAQASQCQWHVPHPSGSRKKPVLIVCFCAAQCTMRGCELPGMIFFFLVRIKVSHTTWLKCKHICAYFNLDQLRFQRINASCADKTCVFLRFVAEMMSRVFNSNLTVWGILIVTTHGRIRPKFIEFCDWCLRYLTILFQRQWLYNVSCRQWKVWKVEVVICLKPLAWL